MRASETTWLVLATRAGALLGLSLALASCDEWLESELPSDEELEEAQAVMLAQQALAVRASDEPLGESVDACLDRVTRETPESVQETIADIGYLELLRDSCRARVAEEERSVEPCAQIQARLVRRACETRVAITARDPDLCPLGPRGHESLCLALASRDPRLCQAAPHLEREACRQLLGEGGACETSISPELCAELVRRHEVRLGSERLVEVPAASRVAPELIVTLTRETAGQAREPIGTETRLESLDRGARIVRESGRVWLELADPLGLSVVSRVGRAAMSLRVPLPPAEGALDAQLDVRVGPLGGAAELAHPELGSLRASSGEIRLSHLSRELGGRVEGTFSLECPRAPGAIRVTGHFRTFVRDVALSAPPDADDDPLPDEP